MNFAKLVESRPDCALVSKEVVSLLSLLIGLTEIPMEIDRFKGGGGGVYSIEL